MRNYHTYRTSNINTYAKNICFIMYFLQVFLGNVYEKKLRYLALNTYQTFLAELWERSSLLLNYTMWPMVQLYLHYCLYYIDISYIHLTWKITMISVVWHINSVHRYSPPISSCCKLLKLDLSILGTSIFVYIISPIYYRHLLHQPHS